MTHLRFFLCPSWPTPLIHSPTPHAAVHKPTPEPDHITPWLKLLIAYHIPQDKSQILIVTSKVLHDGTPVTPLASSPRTPSHTHWLQHTSLLSVPKHSQHMSSFSRTFYFLTLSLSRMLYSQEAHNLHPCVLLCACVTSSEKATLTTSSKIATSVSINRWMDIEDVAHIYNGILLSHEKKQNWVICSEVDGPRVCHTEWRKSEREKHIPYSNTYIWNLKQTKMV